MPSQVKVTSVFFQLSIWFQFIYLIARTNAYAITTTSGPSNFNSTNDPGGIPAYLAHPNQTFLDAMDKETYNVDLPALLSDTDGALPEDNCDGSYYCNWPPVGWGHHRPDQEMCEFAYGRFRISQYYMRRVARYHGALFLPPFQKNQKSLRLNIPSVPSASSDSDNSLSESCVAIFDCWEPTVMTGFQIQRQFDQIRNNGCQRCGTHYFVRIELPSPSSNFILSYHHKEISLIY